MAADLVLAADPQFVERAADPAGFVVAACERARAWLREALEQGQIEQVAELKSQAEAVRVYTAQKQLGKDAQLAAAEIVRRAERGTDGAISLEGTLAGIVAALLVAVAGTAMAVHHLRPGFIGSVVIARSRVLTVITAAAFLGSYVESILGSLKIDIPNDAMNFINTVVGALLFWFAWNFVPMFGWVF